MKESMPTFLIHASHKRITSLVTKHMQQNEIDTVKVHDKVKVNLKNKKTKGSITKDVILKGLRMFFGGNEAQVEGAWTAIQDSAPIKESAAVSVSGLKALAP